MVGEFVEMHDYLDHQRSAQEIAEAIAAKQDGGVFGNHNRWHVTKGRVEPSCKYCSPKGSVSDRSTDRSGTSLTDRFGSTETETDTEELTTSSPSDPAADAATETDNVLMLVQPTSRQDPVDRFAEEFAAFWEHYPRKDDRKKSAAAYTKARKVATAEQLLEGSKAYAALVRREGRSKQHMLLGTSWLNGERWNDEITPPVRDVTAIRGPVFEGA